MNLNVFLAEIEDNGVAYGSRFLVQIPVPLKVQSFAHRQGLNVEGAMARLSLRCDSAELPGYNLLTNENKINGTIYKAPYQGVYGDFTITCILSNDLFEKKLFDAWMLYARPRSDVMEYHANLVTDITVSQYSMSGTGLNSPLDWSVQEKMAYQVLFLDAFPISIAPMQLNWADGDIMRMAVTFAYERWIPLRVTADQQLASDGFVGDLAPEAQFNDDGED